jgi:hypothetical protein
MTTLSDKSNLLKVDLLRMAKDMKPESMRRDLRFLVDLYYNLQKVRIKMGNQIKAIESLDRGESLVLTKILFKEVDELEEVVKRTLPSLLKHDKTSQWAMAQLGIQATLAAPLRAYIDLNRAPTTGHILRFAGLDPTNRWVKAEEAKAMVKEVKEEHPEAAEDIEVLIAACSIRINRTPDRLFNSAMFYEKFEDANAKVPTEESVIKGISQRPWNARLKTVCWKLGDQFVRNHTRGDRCFYGVIYQRHKMVLIKKNLSGEFKELADKTLADRPRMNARDKKIYKDGKIPPGRLEYQARRHAVKMFLHHWHWLAYVEKFKKDPPAPYANGILGHAHYIPPPPPSLDSIKVPKHKKNKAS